MKTRKENSPKKLPATSYQLIRGFTIMELLIYFFLVTVVSVVLVGVMLTIVKVQSQQSFGSEVSSQLDLVFGTVTRLVRQSSVIESASCNPDGNFCSAKLRMPKGSDDPTIISSDASGVYLKQGTADQSALTNGRIVVNSFVLSVSSSGGHAILNIDAAFKNFSPNPVLAITKFLHAAVGRVNAAQFDTDLLPGASNLKIGTQGNPWSSLTIGSSGTPITQIRVLSLSITTPIVSAASTAYQDIVVTSIPWNLPANTILASDKIVANPGGNFGGNCALGSVRVQTADTIRIQYTNPGSSSCASALSTWQILIIRS